MAKTVKQLDGEFQEFRSEVLDGQARLEQLIISNGNGSAPSGGTRKQSNAKRDGKP